MAHVQKQQTRYGTRYEVRWRDPDGKHRQKSFRTYKDAKAFKPLHEADTLRGELRDYDAAGRLLRDAAEAWFRTLEVKPKTRKGYRDVLDVHVLPALGHRKLATITPADCREFVQTLKAKRLAPATIRAAYAPLRRILAQAVEDRALKFNPAVGVRLPTDRTENRPSFAAHFLSEQAVAALAETMDTIEPVYGLLVRFAAYTGLRAGELAGLNVGDLDLLRREVRVVRTRSRNRDGWTTSTPKSERSRRTVPLPPWLADDLAAYLTIHPKPAGFDSPLFPGRRRFPTSLIAGPLDWSSPWDRDPFYKNHFKPALSRAGLPTDVRIHDLRHTYASICAAQGIPLYRVSRRMGHSGIAITDQLYTHLFATDDAADMALLGRPSTISVTRSHPSRSRA